HVSRAERRALRAAGTEYAAILRERQDLALVLEEIALRKDDLRLVAPGNRIVFARPDPLDDVGLDPVMRAKAGEYHEPPGLPAGLGRRKSVASNQKVMRVVPRDEAVREGPRWRAPEFIVDDLPGAVEELDRAAAQLVCGDHAAAGADQPDQARRLDPSAAVF